MTSASVGAQSSGGAIGVTVPYRGVVADESLRCQCCCTLHGYTRMCWLWCAWLRTAVVAALMDQMYPAMRDAKAAVRWVRANAQRYNLSPEHITAIGGTCPFPALPAMPPDCTRLEQ
jgi:hypothetical protein